MNEQIAEHHPHMREMLPHTEQASLRRAIASHDFDTETGQCTCGLHSDPKNPDEHEEHLLEVAFRAGMSMQRRRGHRPPTRGGPAMRYGYST